MDLKALRDRLAQEALVGFRSTDGARSEAKAGKAQVGKAQVGKAPNDKIRGRMIDRIVGPKVGKRLP